MARFDDAYGGAGIGHDDAGMDDADAPIARFGDGRAGVAPDAFLPGGDRIGLRPHA
jgi:hypothetical protein